MLQEEVSMLFRLQNCSGAIVKGPTPCFENSLSLMAFFRCMSIFLPYVSFPTPVYPILILLWGG